MNRLITLAFASLVLFAVPAFADEKKPASPTGTWTHDAGGFEITIAFAKNLTITAMNGENGIVVTASYTTEKDGTVKLKITKVDEKGNFPDKPPLGTEFSFEWKADGTKGKLANFKGENADAAKDVMEGDYKMKKAEKK